MGLCRGEMKVSSQKLPSTGIYFLHDHFKVKLITYLFLLQFCEHWIL